MTNLGIPKGSLDPPLERNHSPKERLLQSRYMENLSLYPYTGHTQPWLI